MVSTSGFRINPYLPIGLSHAYQSNEAISNFWVPGVLFQFILFLIEIHVSKQCRPWSGLHCLLMSQLWEIRHKKGYYGHRKGTKPSAIFSFSFAQGKSFSCASRYPLFTKFTFSSFKEISTISNGDPIDFELRHRSVNKLKWFLQTCLYVVF